MNDDQSPKDEGSVWASYSDLFTNVAIIFLVMFVFALLKAGISKIETAAIKKKHENELKASLNAGEIKKSEEKIKKVEKSLDEMKVVESLVNEKMKEIQEFSQKMQQNKQVLNELIHEQRRKDSLLNVVSQKLIERENKIQQLEHETRDLQQKIEVTTQEKSQLEQHTQKREIASINEKVQAKEQTKELKKHLTKLQQEKQKKEQELQKDLTQLQNEKSKKEEELKQMLATHEKSKVTLDSMEQQKTELEKRIQDSQNQVASLSQTKTEMESEMSRLGQSKMKMESQVKELKSKISKLGKEKEDVLTDFSAMEAQNGSLKNELKKIGKNLDNSLAEIAHYKGLHQGELGKVKGLEGAMKEAQEKMKNLGRAFADMKGKLRSTVADNLKKKFIENQMQVTVDGKTGNLILVMGSNFTFKKNSHDLSEKAQETLKKIAPLYAEVIFGDKGISSRVEAIHITGHASPSFKKTYVDPKSDHAEAYAHNMRLSAQRAASVANYMMGKPIGSYSYKGELREHIHAIGRGYIAPVEKVIEGATTGRSLASVSASDCGPYDCALSQRVEIGFSLKDDMKALEKIINMAGEK